MSCEEDVKALVDAGYKMNPYMGWWSKSAGGKTAYVNPDPNGGAYAEMRNGGESWETERFRTLAEAIEAGDRWLEGQNDQH